jgi:aldehyde:ferredoxin oxidoreductase
MATSYGQLFSDTGMCLFALSAGCDFPLIEFMRAVTGWDFSAAEALETGKRILTLRQAFNTREGLTADNFSIPKRIAEPPTAGPLTGRNIDFNALRASYYKSINWDVVSGIPTQKCLEDLQLTEVVNTFKK